MNCPFCLSEMPHGAITCRECGRTYNNKNKGAYIFLALFFGGLGIHKFFIGKIGQGIAYLLFFWTLIPAVIAWLDILIAIFTNEEDWKKF